MRFDFDELMLKVNQHQAFYQGLADLLAQEYDALLKQDLERICQTANAKEILAGAIREHVSGLTEAIRAAASALGLVAEPLPSLSELSRSMPEPYAGKLHQAALSLTRLKKDVARDSRANQNFVRQSMDAVSASIAILTGATALQKKGYGSKGQKQGPAVQEPVRLSREI